MQNSCLDGLPLELLRHVVSFACIPSLGRMAQTGKNLLSQCACEDFIWAQLVERRFRIATSKTTPRFHGGNSWKRAFSSMSQSDRIPRGRYTTSRKAVFAKSKSKGGVGLWVLMSHTENCTTRTVSQLNRNTRHVELYLCIQNVKSSGGEVVADVLEASLMLLGSPEILNPLNTASLRPKVLFHDAQTSSRNHDDFAFDVTNGVRLRPFEISIVSMHFPCSPEVYETDFLARAVSLHVPIRKPVNKRNTGTPSELPYAATWPEVATALGPRRPFTTAVFIPEREVWSYYEKLPGGCLTLVDRYSMIRA